MNFKERIQKFEERIKKLRYFAEREERKTCKKCGMQFNNSLELFNHNLFGHRK